MKIGIDAMGGDFAPFNVVKGAIGAFSCIQEGTKLLLFGDKTKITEICSDCDFDVNNFEIVHTTEILEMTDHPAKALTQKSDSSIAVGFKYLAEKKIDGFASAGNTGAMMVGAIYTISLVDGVLRPCISSYIPLLNGKSALLLDVGFNVDAKPENFVQFAQLGSTFAREVMGYENPRVALVNVGEEEEKGSILVKAAYQKLKEAKGINFVGNIEGHELFTGAKAEVIVCDGYVGNVILKQAEATYRISQKLGMQHDFFDRFNYELYGGTPALGVNAPVVIGHGASTELAIKNMILQTETVIKVDLINKIKTAIKNE